MFHPFTNKQKIGVANFLMVNYLKPDQCWEGHQLKMRKWDDSLVNLKKKKKKKFQHIRLLLMITLYHQIKTQISFGVGRNRILDFLFNHKRFY